MLLLLKFTQLYNIIYLNTSVYPVSVRCGLTYLLAKTNDMPVDGYGFVFLAVGCSIPDSNPPDGICLFSVSCGG